MRRGCPLGAIGSELTEEDVMVREALTLLFEALKERVATFLKKEKEKGRVVRTARTQQLAEFYVASIQGAVLCRYSYVRLTDPESLEKCLVSLVSV